jgi:NADPH-dependent 2,4-dienoyl-CoA reductase/sulfur reductase-like enzyme
MNRQDKAPVPAEKAGDKPYLDRADVVIIGNGIAGLTAAVEARRMAPDKRIVIITDQIHPTINTPALKQFAIAKLTREQLLAYPAGTERKERIHLVTGRVEEIHANSKYVTLKGGRGFGYESLLIATGSAPGGLPADLPGREFDGVLTLHRLQDYLDLRRRLPEISEAVVIGGGVHAIETVMGLLYWGIRVHWLIRSSTFMGNMLDKEASEVVLESMRRSGAIVHTQTEVAGVVGRVGVVMGVITNNQEMIPCQLILSCTGTQPVMKLAERCSQPLSHKKGIIVDDQLRTSVRDIYAAGDVAALKNPLTGNYEPRAQWFAAVSQGRIAGAMLVGHVEAAQQPFGVQWHATHLGELSMLTVGSPLMQENKIMTLTDSSSGSYRRMAIVGDRLVGYLSVGRSHLDSLAIKRIIDEGHSIRNITKDLLKGSFDARQYLSRIHSSEAQGILVTRKLPDLPQGEYQRSPSRPLPANPLANTGERELVSQPLFTRQERPAARETEPLQASNPGMSLPGDFSAPPYEEEVSPFTGNLPALSRRRTANEENTFSSDPPQTAREVFEEEVSPFTGNLPAISSQKGKRVAEPVPVSADFFEEEVSPFTGNLPAISPRKGKRVVEPTQLPVPSSDWKPKQSLWSYAEKPKDTQNIQQRRAATQNGGEAPRGRHTSGLWSYAGREEATRVEKRR